MNIKVFISYLIINVPVFIFLFISSIFLFFSLYFKNFWFLIGGWQCFSAAVMLTIDFYQRKRNNFNRMLLAFQRDKKPSKAVQTLKQTICGFFVLTALKYRLKKTIFNILSVF
ncbi:MAG TPA: hypothetical protein PLO89_09455 [Spirochaetota bacterium]|nr:hypothetical protein [Spirochaetota bacterium]